YKFGAFVEWPQSAFASDASPAVLCVAGSDPFGGTLDKVVDGQHIANRPIVVRRLDMNAVDAGCQILFVASADEKQMSEALESVRGAGVLTSTDAARTDRSAGIITFVVTGNRVRFEIDDKAASA